MVHDRKFVRAGLPAEKERRLLGGKVERGRFEPSHELTFVGSLTAFHNGDLWLTWRARTSVKQIIVSSLFGLAHSHFTLHLFHIL